MYCLLVILVISCSNKSNKQFDQGKRGVVSSAHPLASEAGIKILESGGNAIDAAITAALMLVLCEPQSTGLFGDAFAIIKSKKAKGIIGLNGSGKAPMDLRVLILLYQV